MIVPYLRLENFRNHVDSVLKFGNAGFIVIRGGNHDGKSSIAQAFSMCLTPTTDGLDAQGRGFISKIRRGQAKAVITMQVQGQHLIERKVTLSTTTTGRTNSNKCLDDPDWHPLPFEQVLEAHKAPLGIALNTDYFLGLDDKEQSKILARLVLPRSYEFPEETIAQVDRLVGPGVVPWNGEPFVAIAKAYKLLFEERTVVNRQVRDFAMPSPLALPEGLDSKKLQIELDTARTERQRVMHDRTDAESKAREAIAKRSKLEGQIQSNQTRLREESKRLESAKSQILTETKLHDFTALAEKKPRLDQLSKTHLELETECRRLRGEIAKYEKLPVDGSECHACGQQISKKHIDQALAFHREALQLKLDTDREIFDEIKALGGVEDAIQALKANDAAVKTKEAIESIISEKSRLLKSDQAKIDKTDAAEDPATKFSTPLKQADDKIDALQAKLRPVIAAEERVGEIARLSAELTRLQEKSSILTTLVAYFDADGIRAKLLSDHVGAFEKKLNVVMKAWKYSCAFSIEEFTTTDDHGVTTPVRELSGSEKLMFSIALQASVSQIAGIEFIVCDRMDTLLPDERAKAYGCLFELIKKGLLKQVFLLVSDETTEVPPIPNSAFYMVKNGEVARL